MKNSNAMEKEGFLRCLNRLIAYAIQIEAISTDRHNQIRKKMRTEPVLKLIKHLVDPWHIIKGIVKKIKAMTKKKSCKVLGNISRFFNSQESLP